MRTRKTVNIEPLSKSDIITSQEHTDDVLVCSHRFNCLREEIDPSPWRFWIEPPSS